MHELLQSDTSADAAVLPPNRSPLPASADSLGALDQRALQHNDGDGRPAVRTILYLVATAADQADAHAELAAYVDARNWDVVQVRADEDGTECVWLRLGLLAAIAAICYGQADCVVMSELSYAELTPSDKIWLRGRIKHYGGFLRIMPWRSAQATTLATLREGRKRNLGWEIRYTWQCQPGIKYPAYTYSAVPSEERAIEATTTVLARPLGNGDLRLVTAHWRHVSDCSWTSMDEHTEHGSR